jgi:hypothetical protein
MQRIGQGKYARQEIIEQLHFKHGTNLVRFRYDLLSRDEKKIGTLDTVRYGTVSMAALAQIKRTARFALQDTGDIDWLNDRIQPFCMLRMPDGGWAEWSQGIFLLSTPKRREENRKVYRDVEAYDGLQVLLDDKFGARYTVPAGANYATAIIGIMVDAGITKINLQGTDKTLATAREFEPGTSRLEAINKLLTEINYTALWVDEWGYYTASTYRSPQDRAVEYTYKDDALSVLYSGAEEEMDLFSIPNKWVVVASNPEQEPLVSTYVNDNPDSKTSTVGRGRVITDYRTIENTADQASLDAYVQRIAFEASQVYTHITLMTAVMPFHSYSDVLQLEYGPLGISGKYSETGWTMPLEAGAEMTHQVRRAVNI